MQSILFIALTPGMADIAARAARELKVSFPIEVVSFEKGAEVAKENSDADVMVSRGLMVDLLRQHTEVPVVGLTMTIEELLESVNKLMGVGAKKIGVVVHRRFLDMDRSDISIGNISILLRPWNTLAEIPEILKKLRDEGVDAISGDKGGYTRAKEQGFIVDLIESGLNAIKRTIKEALKISQVQSREREREREKTQKVEMKLSELYSELEQSAASVEELAASSEELAASSQDSSNIAKRITKEVDKITEILQVIHLVARQTNLLGVNAAIEAAHAAGYGRGFSVVAGEIRKLAQESNKSAKDIDEMLVCFQQSVIQVQENVEQCNVIAQEQATATQVLSGKLGGIRVLGENLKTMM